MELPAGLVAPPGTRLGVVAAESPSGRHIIIVGMNGGAAAAAAARARQLLPNGKLPTPPGIIANLPTYDYVPPPSAGGAEKAAVAAADAAAVASGGGGGAANAAEDLEKGAAAVAASGDGGAAAAAASGGDAPPPAPAAAAAPAAAGDGDDGEGDICVICCDAFEAGARIKLLPCMHSFHAECIDAWLARDTHCPNCRESVIRAAGISEAEALDAVIAAAAGLGESEAERRRQIDGNPWALGGSGGGGQRGGSANRQPGWP